MNKKLRKRISDIVFAIAIVAMIIPSSREWIMRQIAFSPSVNDVEDMVLVDSYNWQLKGLNAEDYNFEEARGKVVFVNFWATWCPPCRAEMPMIQKLYDDYKDKVEFIFVTTDSREEIAEFFKKNGYDLPSYNSLTTAPDAFRTTNSIPVTYLVDKSGKVVIDKVGAADWNSDKTRRLIDELIKK